MKIAISIILKKYPIFEKYFSEIIPIILFTPLYFLKIISSSNSINIDYIGYTITIISIMLGFYFSNIFIISSAPKDSIIGQLSIQSQKNLFKYNTRAIHYSILIIICYLFVNAHSLAYYLFIYLIFCNITSAIRIYALMYISAEGELDQRLNNKKSNL